MALGFCNGMFAVAAIGSMMALAGEGREAREGTRMGLWGAAQAIAAGFGGLTGAARSTLRASDAARDRLWRGVPVRGGLFLAAAVMAARIIAAPPARPGAMIPGE